MMSNAASRCCKYLSLLSLLSLALLPVGCSKNNTAVSAGKTTEFNLAMDLMSAGKNDQAINLLAAEDIEKCFRESSHVVTKISNKSYMALSGDEQNILLKDVSNLLGLIKGATVKQIDELKVLQSKGSSEEAEIMEEKMQRLADRLQDKDYMIYQQLGDMFESKLKEVTASE